ncbi:hypothetical protein [Adhaeribacter radiodurans]|uniref:YceK/YidQ family lipoprotein n=1 Tax=Adhaeribacter radiodurans TaxID=2745197 RepID=A0A7L7L4X5_9BACT|nr:hypothetical protein [Adhaeribacter radiodurans]QMU27830.1 hypothetical protein HUW48_07125 [Adhaeribacter radiodurans]
MKKITQVAAVVLLTVSMSSCATLFGGKVTAYQKTRPAAGEPQREIRIGALVADVLLFWPSLAVDFATGAIYKPQEKTSTNLNSNSSSNSNTNSSTKATTSTKADTNTKASN